MRRARQVGAFEPEDERAGLHQVGMSVVWAFVAVVALTVAFMAAQSDPGTRRVHAVLNNLPWPLRNTTSLADDPATTTRNAREDAEARSLTETVKTLATDRDRLMARIALLERDHDATGSLAKRNGKAGASSDASSLFTGPSLTLAMTADEHSVAPPALTPAAAIASVMTKGEFGVDLGTAPTIEGLRVLWDTLKAEHSELSNDLRPVIAMQENDVPGVVAIRLVAGPLANAAAAARLCAKLAGTLTTCQPTTFDGQRLAAH